jgi:uncharacterized protein Yka (UPF0111/DUF47 family)
MLKHIPLFKEQEMTSSAHQETMQRKPILMPPDMVSRIDKIARSRNVSFAKVVREAVDAFDEGLGSENAALLEALADTMIQTTKEIVKKIEKVEKKLDETHAVLEDR